VSDPPGRFTRSFPSKPEALTPSPVGEHFAVLAKSPFEMTVDEAAALVGKTVLVSKRYVTEAGDLLSHTWFFGRVVEADAARVTVKRDGTDEPEYLAPDRLLFRPAPPGEYRLSPPGEVVTDPDVLVTMTILAGALTAD
jgi:hypothetical protein